MRWMAAFLVLVLAGCSATPPSSEAPDTTYEDLGLQAAQDRGVIRGVVVDEAITPLPGAVVTRTGGESATTDAQGRFGFSNVEPGTQFLSASRPGYTSVQSVTEVEAGVLEPRSVTIQLTRIPGSEPRVVALVWHGFMQCSWTLGGAFATGCLVSDFTDDNSRAFDAIDAEPSFLQSETLWEPTQTLGTSFCMRQYASEDIGGDVLVDDVCGESPLVQQVDGARLNETGVGTTQGLERLVWVSGYGAPQGPGFALNQQFDLYTHLFYNVVPDPEWRFWRDGPYPLT